MSYYDLLKVAKNASPEEIKKQYKKLALEHHPDRGGDSDIFKQISEAYQTLSEPQKRKEYDNPSPFFHQMPQERRHGAGFVDPDELFKHFFSNGFGNINGNMRNNGLHTTTINFGNGIPHSGQVFQRCVSTTVTVRGDTKIETVTETKDGVRTETVIQTNMKTGKSQKQVKEIDLLSR
jgi:DnaJ-class molecular chaperone